jgi:hypothetical protein
LGFLVACSPGASGPTSTPTIDPATPAAQTAQAGVEQTEQAETTAASKATADTKATQDAKATAESGATSTAVSQLTATKVSLDATATANQVARETESAAQETEAAVQKTAQAQPMYDLVLKLAEDGFLTKAEGTYTRLEDFDESEALIDYLHPFPTQYDPKDFVLRTDMAWESASDKANWNNSGCGLIFHWGDTGAFYAAGLYLDGYVKFDMHKPDYSYMTAIGKKQFDTLNPEERMKGSAEFLLIVETETGVTIFVNDKMIYRYQSPLTYIKGLLGYTIISGTNKDFGTRCQMTDIDLWEFQ